MRTPNVSSTIVVALGLMCLGSVGTAFAQNAVKAEAQVGAASDAPSTHSSSATAETHTQGPDGTKTTKESVKHQSATVGDTSVSKTTKTTEGTATNATGDAAAKTSATTSTSTGAGVGAKAEAGVETTH